MIFKNHNMKIPIVFPSIFSNNVKPKNGFFCNCETLNFLFKRIIYVLTTSIPERKNIWHFCNILYTGSATPTSRIYMTPTVSSPVVQGSTGSGPLLMPNTKVEARRRLNLDSALVDRDGFKTPIKGTKRKHDFSSPSPKKCKFSSLLTH